jgi:hypothetical protein
MAVGKFSAIASITLLILVGISLYRPLFAQTTTPQFKEFKEQYGRFSIQVPKDWTLGSPTIKQDSVTISFDPKWDDILFSVVSADIHTTSSEGDYEQVIREDNAATVADTPGATLIQDTECTKYVIDGDKACSMIYSVTHQQYTQKEMDIDFQTTKQRVHVSLSGSVFDKYLPVAQQMLNSMKVS